MFRNVDKDFSQVYIVIENSIFYANQGRTAKLNISAFRPLFLKKAGEILGRPSKYETSVKPFFKEIKAAFNKGVDEKEIANSLGISVSSWCDYKNKYSEFAELLKRDEDETKNLLERLDSALMKIAEGFEYQEKKQYITEDESGKKKKHTEIYTKYCPPNPTAIFGAYNRFDPNYKKDKAYYDLKKQELELKKLIAESSNFDLNIDDLEV